MTAINFFDIDDTLVHTTAMIGVKKDGVVTRRLTNQEFNTYKLQPGEEFDFSEFTCSRKFATESTPIRTVIDVFNRVKNAGDVRLLTARSDFDCKETFLRSLECWGIDHRCAHVHRSGNLQIRGSTAEKKAVWVRRYLDNPLNRYTEVSLYDDSLENLRVFASLGDEYPHVTFHPYLVERGAIRKI